MNVEIINTGSELLLGRILNTHQQWLCAQISELGLIVQRQTAVADSGPAIVEAVREALNRADIVITTGGLGPTSDDLTREYIAQLLGKKLLLDRTVLASIDKYFEQRKRCAPERTKVQALVPEGAIVLANDNGTAPGLAIEINDEERKPTVENGGSAQQSKWLIMLPGPPRELRPMFTQQVVPLVQKSFSLPPYVCRILKTTGLGESLVEEKIAVPLQNCVSSGLDLGYCARVGEVEVRLAAHGANAAKLVGEAESITRQLLGGCIFCDATETLESVVVQLLTKSKQTLALAESCTGGHIANRITNVPGASTVLMAGLVTYSNDSKQRLLGVRSETLDTFGAVSEQTVREMAEGARTRNKTDFAISVSGIAGPTGETPDKPLGTVFIALATADETIVEHHVNRYDRETFKFITAQQALDLLRRRISIQ